MRPYIERLSKIATCYVSAYPNAGLPNPLSETGYDEGPEDTSSHLEDFAESGFVNAVGGCCGTSPEHIQAIAKKVKNVKAREIPKLAKTLNISGLEPYSIDSQPSPLCDGR